MTEHSFLNAYDITLRFALRHGSGIYSAHVTGDEDLLHE